MTIITVPDIEASFFELSLVRGDTLINLMSHGSVVVAPPKAFWLATVPLTVMQQANARQWFSALTALSKLENSMRITPPDYSAPASGYAGADPAVKGADQLGTSLLMDGVTVSTLILSDGDYFEVNGEFKVCRADATSDGSGNVTVTFEPALRSAPADNAPVRIVALPRIEMRLVNPRAVQGVRPGKVYDHSLELMEKIDA
jgi:hypothetical protein